MSFYVWVPDVPFLVILVYIKPWLEVTFLLVLLAMFSLFFSQNSLPVTDFTSSNQQICYYRKILLFVYLPMCDESHLNITSAAWQSATDCSLHCKHNPHTQSLGNFFLFLPKLYTVAHSVLLIGLTALHYCSMQVYFPFLVASFFSLFCCFPMKMSVPSACVSVFGVTSTGFFSSITVYIHKKLRN